MSREIEVSKDIIVKYLKSSLTARGIYELLEIQNGGKELLYDHIKALYDIFGKALEKKISEFAKKYGLLVNRDWY